LLPDYYIFINFKNIYQHKRNFFFPFSNNSQRKTKNSTLKHKDRTHRATTIKSKNQQLKTIYRWGKQKTKLSFNHLHLIWIKKQSK